MDSPTPSLTDLATMTAMRIATNGRAVARVTAELALQDLEDALNATDGLRAGMSSYLITGNH